MITDETGAKVQNLTYFPYGGTNTNTPGTPVDVPYKYTGKELDATTGLYFYEARYYDPTLGRFLSADTIVPSAGDPQALNRYAYARNNPIMFNDPSGHFFKSIVKVFRSVVRGIGKVIKDNIVLRVAAWTFAPGFTMNLDPDSQPYVVQGGAMAIGFAVGGPVGAKFGKGVAALIISSSVGGAASGGARAGINSTLGYKEDIGLAIATGAASGLVSAGGFSAGAMTGNSWGAAAGVFAGNLSGAAISAAVTGADPGKAVIRAGIQTAAVMGLAIGLSSIDGFSKMNPSDLRDTAPAENFCMKGDCTGVVGGANHYEGFMDFEIQNSTNSTIIVDIFPGVLSKGYEGGGVPTYFESLSQRLIVEPGKIGSLFKSGRSFSYSKVGEGYFFLKWGKNELRVNGFTGARQATNMP